MNKDVNDYSSKYNTVLSPEEEKAYQIWATKTGRGRDVYDYDMRGAWKNNVSADGDEHYPDTYKKPNHPTFSDQSIYHGADGLYGGTWFKPQADVDTFIPSRHNLDTHRGDVLPKYFQKVERTAEGKPRAKILMPMDMTDEQFNQFMM